MTAAGVSCGSCGTALRANAKFCDACGIPTVSGDTAKFRQVTVLFADVVRSMDIAATVELERLRVIMTALIERSAAVAQRYGGTVEYNGDGVMALFGAPAALEDHAVRGCLAALAIQEEASRLAVEVQRLDSVALQVRVGLNSGRVIAGEIGSSSLGYAATGEAVGLAQRMESVAPPGGVLISESTARLVEHVAVLSEPEWVRIKGTDKPVRASRLVAISPRDGRVARAEASLVGRRWEMAALDAIVERSINRRGGVVNVVGPPGIGKSRSARETAALAAARGVEVCWAFCESHASDISFHVVAQLLRASTGTAGVDGVAARVQLRTQLPGADPQDLLLFDDLLGIADADVPLPQIDPEARRRRLAALINTTALTRTQPVLYIVEDAHWIDEVSESMLAELLAIIPRTSSMALITARPEYVGALARVPGAQKIALAPLGDSDVTAMLAELLGSDPSVRELATIVAERAAGSPFFAEEMVRELVQRGVLTGELGGYVSGADVAEVSVPATVQAAIAARIDQLSVPAKQTLNAASVVGGRFEADLVAALGIAPEFDELVGVELIDQVRFTPSPEYAFRHALIRAVAYESQLKSDRAEWHRRLATAIQERAPGSVEENAALIAEHLQNAGDLLAAYGWQMRAGGWSATRDIGAARVSWERARDIADALADPNSAQGPDELSMRIAPRTMLCATDWLAIQGTSGRFEELRELCNAAGDKVSLAIGMTGLATELLYAGGTAGSQLCTEQMALLESIGDPALTMGLAFTAFATWFNGGQFGEILWWSQNVIDLAVGDATKGAGFGIGSPLAVGLTFRSIARWWLGEPGWRRDIDDAVAIARASDATMLALSVAWAYCVPITYGVIQVDDTALHAAEEAERACQSATNDYALRGAQFALGCMLLYRDAEPERQRGLELMVQSRDVFLPDRAPSLVPVATVLAAREAARRGDRDAAIPEMRAAVHDLYRARRFGWHVFTSRILVEALLEGGTEENLAEAQQLIDELAHRAAAEDSTMLEITLLRLRTLLAGARGEGAAHRDLVGRYREMAESLGFEGHIHWAQAM